VNSAFHIDGELLNRLITNYVVLIRHRTLQVS